MGGYVHMAQSHLTEAGIARIDCIINEACASIVTRPPATAGGAWGRPHYIL